MPKITLPPWRASCAAIPATLRRLGFVVRGDTWVPTTGAAVTPDTDADASHARAVLANLPDVRVDYGARTEGSPWAVDLAAAARYLRAGRQSGWRYDGLATARVGWVFDFADGSGLPVAPTAIVLDALGPDARDYLAAVGPGGYAAFARAVWAAVGEGVVDEVRRRERVVAVGGDVRRFSPAYRAALSSVVGSGVRV